VTWQRECLFGEIVDSEMRLNEYGEIVRKEWMKTGRIRANVQIHENEFVIMPNHVHGIIWIVDDNDPIAGARRRHVGARRRRAPTERFGKPVLGSIPTIVRAYKSVVTFRINALRGIRGMPVWQRNFYEHIIRDEQQWERIHAYIEANPLNLESDEENR